MYEGGKTCHDSSWGHGRIFYPYRIALEIALCPYLFAIVKSRGIRRMCHDVCCSESYLTRQDKELTTWNFVKKQQNRKTLDKASRHGISRLQVQLGSG